MNRKILGMALVLVLFFAGGTVFAQNNIQYVNRTNQTLTIHAGGKQFTLPAGGGVVRDYENWSGDVYFTPNQNIDIRRQNEGGGFWTVYFESRGGQAHSSTSSQGQNNRQQPTQEQREKRRQTFGALLQLIGVIGESLR